MKKNSTYQGIPSQFLKFQARRKLRTLPIFRISPPRNFILKVLVAINQESQRSASRGPMQWARISGGISARLSCPQNRQLRACP